MDGNDKITIKVKGHTRNGVAVDGYTQMRPGAKPPTSSKGSKAPGEPSKHRRSSFVGGGARNGLLGIVAETEGSTSGLRLSASEWKSLIREKETPGPPNAQDAISDDGATLEGKKKLIVAVKRVFVSLHDDPATTKVEQIPDDVHDRQVFEIDVPEGTEPDYETIKEAFVQKNKEDHTELTSTGMYGDVQLVSVMVQEWEVVANPDPKKVWSHKRETWEKGEVLYNQNTTKKAE